MIDFANSPKFVDRCWDDSVVPTLVEYIRIPNKSLVFDRDWRRTVGSIPQRIIEALGTALPREFGTPNLGSLARLSGRRDVSGLTLGQGRRYRLY
jgi:hypothetical protein